MRGRFCCVVTHAGGREVSTSGKRKPSMDLLEPLWKDKRKLIRAASQPRDQAHAMMHLGLCETRIHTTHTALP